MSFDVSSSWTAALCATVESCMGLTEGMELLLEPANGFLLVTECERLHPEQYDGGHSQRLMTKGCVASPVLAWLLEGYLTAQIRRLILEIVL